MSDEKQHYRITPSLLNNWNCARKGSYTDIVQIGLKEAKNSPSLDIGSLFHSMAEVYYQLMMWSDFDVAARRIEAIRYGRRRAVETAMDREDIETAIRTFEEYTVHYANEQIEPLEVEQPFSKLFYEDDRYVVVMEGKKDLVAVIQDRPWIIDHKTESKKGIKSPLSNQFFAYSWASGHRTIIHNQVGTQKTLAPKEKFKRHYISYTDEQIDEWYANTVHRVKELIGYIKNKFFPKNFTVCKSNFSLCQFHSICTAVPDDRDRVIDVYYEHRDPHDPFEDVDG